MLSEHDRAIFNKYRKIVDDHILDFIPEIDPLSKDLYDSMKYALLSGGKRIRPVLVLAACEMFNTPLAFVIPYACAVEYVHTYSLIHDDLPCMDDDDMRRGKPTVHKQFGEANAVLAGDGLLSCAFETMNKDMLMYLDDPELLKRKVRAAYSLSKGCGCRGMVAGQVTDIATADEQSSTDLINYVNYKKTACLIRASVMMGGFLGGMNSDTWEDLSIYGENIGMAFQLADDLADSSSGQDADEATYVQLFGREKAVEQAEQYIRTARNAIEKYYDHGSIYRFLADLLETRIHE